MLEFGQSSICFSLGPLRDSQQVPLEVEGNYDATRISVFIAEGNFVVAAQPDVI